MTPIVEEEAGLDEEPLADIYRRYAVWLEKVIRRNGGGDASEDIVQETYIRVAKLPAGTALRHPQALLGQIAQNILRNDARRARAAKRTAARCASHHEFDRVEADQLELLTLRETIHAMPKAYRDVFILSRFNGMSNQQVAATCNLSLKAVEWRISKALAFCAARMRD